jgi:hypothetical protein
MTEASDPHSDNKDSHADNTKLSELITTQEAQEGELRKRDKSKPVANDITCLAHAAMPSITSIELIGWSDIQKKIAQRCLESVESKIKNVKREDSYANGSVCGLPRAVWIPVTGASAKDINKETSNALTISQS